jgi:hypothetical protein
MKKLLFSSFFALLLFSSASAQLITIDAERDAFYDQLTGPDDGKIFIPARCYLEDVSPGGPLGGPEGGDADLSGTVWSCWEYPYLYFYTEIKDDTVIVNNATSSGSQWQNDKIELKIDPDPTQADVSTGVIQAGITALDSTDAEAPTAVDNLTQDNELQLADGTLYVPTPEDYARRMTDDGYVLEFRIHMDYLNKGTRFFPAPEEGLVFGMTINIADNDSAARRDMLQWSAGHADQAWSFPRYQGSVTLLADNKIKYEAISPNDPTIINENAQDWYYTPFDFVDERQIGDVPVAFNLMQNYPNPFNPTTVIRYDLEKETTLSLTVYNIAGEAVRYLISNQPRRVGSHELVWDGTDEKGIQLPSGVYFYQIKSNSAIVTKKMILLR